MFPIFAQRRCTLLSLLTFNYLVSMVAMVTESSGNLGDIQLYHQEKLQSEYFKQE